MKRNSFLASVCVFVLFSSILYAQNNNIDEPSVTVEWSNEAQQLCTDRHPVAAVTGMYAALFGISSWNRWVTQASWAKISYQDVLSFYDKEVKWDRDWYWTNFVLHPYQGSFAYMSFKDSGFTTGESLIAATVSSAIWEWFYETNAPSKNDMVYTSLGALAVGEMLGRLSSEASSYSGLASFALNPTRLITQPLCGHKVPGTTGHIYEMTAQTAFSTSDEIAFFAEKIDGKSSESEKFPFFVTPEFYIVYNDPYGHDSNNPYSQFELKTGAALGIASGKGYDNCEYDELEKNLYYDLSIFSNGMLFSRAPDFGENKDTSVGMSFLYDFKWNNMYELSALGPAFAIKQRIRNEDDSKFEWQTHLGWAVLCTSDCYYFRRNYIIPQDGVSAVYSYNTGIESYLMGKWTGAKGHELGLSAHIYALYDFTDQLQENAKTGWEFIQIVEGNYGIPLSDRFTMGLREELYIKEALINDYPDYYQFMHNTGVYFKVNLK